MKDNNKDKTKIELTYCRERQRAPIITLQILFHNVRRFCIMIHPVFTTESIVFVNYMVQAPVPMEYH